MGIYNASLSSSPCPTASPSPISLFHSYPQRIHFLTPPILLPRNHSSAFTTFIFSLLLSFSPSSSSSSSLPLSFDISHYIIIYTIFGFLIFLSLPLFLGFPFFWLSIFLPMVISYFFYSFFF